MPKKIITLAGIGILALIVGFSIRYYSEGGLPVNILQNGLEKLAAATSYKYTSSITIAQLDASGATTEANTIIVDITGANDKTNSSAPKGTASISTKIQYNPQLVGIIEPGYIKIDAIFIGAAAYLKLNAMPKISFDVSPLINQWVKINHAEMSATAGAPQPPEISPEKITRLQSEFTQSKILRLTARLANAKINGETVRHFAVIFDKERLITFFPRVMAWQEEVTGRKLTPDEQKSTEKLVNYLREVPANEYPTGDIYIGQTDGAIHRMVFSKITKPMYAGAKNNSEKTPALAIKISTDYQNFGETVQISEPKGTISMQDAINKVMMAMNQPAATVSYEEIDWWLSTVPGTTRPEIIKARKTFTAKYTQQTKPLIKTSVYEGCGAYQLKQAINALPSKEMDRIRGNTQLSEALGVTGKTTDAAIRTQIPIAVYNQYIKTDIIAGIGAEQVAAVDQISISDFTKMKPSKSACVTLYGPEQ